MQVEMGAASNRLFFDQTENGFATRGVFFTAVHLQWARE